MKRCSFIVTIACALCVLSSRAFALSAVFDGDPVDPATSLPYEILPGKPLVQAGPDGLLGTADDVINPSIVGDVDLVVRSGTVTASPVIPPPALSNLRDTLPVGVAGPQSAGGNEIPFTVFLSDGVTSAAAPAGRLLPAADMDGLPVIVAAFPDLDGDGFIGPTTHAAASGSRLALEVRELMPVGRAAALFSGGVAHGSIAVRTALPASSGGLTIALVAMALTGPLDPNFFAGAIPSGPAIATALPFLPERDLNRLIRDRPVPAGPGTTLQQLIQSAAVPPPSAYAVPLDGSSPTIDGAVVISQPAVRVSFRDHTARRGTSAPLVRATLGMRPLAGHARWRLVPVDRFENLADPPPGFLITLSADPQLHFVGWQRAGQARPRIIRHVNGLSVSGRVMPSAVDGATGTVRIERDGVIVAALPYAIDARADHPLPDITVPSIEAPTIQAAVDGATDLNQDGAVVVAVRPGLYHENVIITRALQLVGTGSDLTFIQGDGTASALAATAPDVVVRGVTAVGGLNGFNLGAATDRLAASSAWRNFGPGVAVAGADAQIWQCTAQENAGDGVAIGVGANGATCSDTLLLANGGVGASVQSAQNAQLVDNQAVLNATGGLLVAGGDASSVHANRSVINLGPGVQVISSTGSTVTGNLCALNDDDGLHIDRGDGAFVSANVLDDNKGYGLFLRRTSSADFDAASGVQAPLGDNSAANNRKGDLFIRTN
jgi:parallel beta helix pectate lyase-like protein